MKQTGSKTPSTRKTASATNNAKPVAEDGALAFPILRHMHLVDIHQVKSEAIRHPAFDKKQSGAKLDILAKEEMNVAYHSENRSVVAIVSVGIEAKIEGIDMFAISAIYRAIYQVKDSYTGDLVEERAKAFCRSTSLAHIWSYWRESLISTSMRMGLPPIMAPLLIVGAKIPNEKSRGKQD